MEPVAAAARLRPQTPHRSIELGSESADLEAVVDPNDDVQLCRSITTRHMVLMAMGTSIGAGLFVGSGQALAAGGPGSVLVCFLIVGIMVVLTMLALGEMAATYPVAGAFYDYAVRFVDPAWGFAMGWNYVINWLIVLPFEMTVIAAQVMYWIPPHFVQENYSWLFFLVIVGMLIIVTTISCRGSKWFANSELFLSALKIATLLVFLLLSFVITAGGISGMEANDYGIKLWSDPGAFRNGVKGFLLVFRIAGMSYGGTEMLGLTAAECKNPGKMIPLASKITLFRMAFLYLLPLFMLGLILRSDNESLIEPGKGMRASPFVVASDKAGLPGFSSFFNAAILFAIFSMANAAGFASSRALQALCHKGMGPSWGDKVTKKGLPVGSLAVALACSHLAFIGVIPDGREIFDWLLSLSGVSNYLSWLTICLSHIRLRRALHRHGLAPSVLAWRSWTGVWGSKVAIGICIFSLAALITGAACPPSGKLTTKDFLRDFLGIPVVLALYAGYQIWHRQKFGHWVWPQPIALEMIVPNFQSPVEIKRNKIESPTEGSEGEKVK